MHAKSYKSLNDVLKNLTNSKLKADVMLKSGNLPFASQKGRMWLKINKFHFTQWKTTEELKISLKGTLYNTICEIWSKDMSLELQVTTGDCVYPWLTQTQSCIWTHFWETKSCVTNKKTFPRKQDDTYQPCATDIANPSFKPSADVLSLISVIISALDTL